MRWTRRTGKSTPRSRISTTPTASSAPSFRRSSRPPPRMTCECCAPMLLRPRKRCSGTRRRGTPRAPSSIVQYRDAILVRIATLQEALPRIRVLQAQAATATTALAEAQTEREAALDQVGIASTVPDLTFSAEGQAVVRKTRVVKTAAAAVVAGFPIAVGVVLLLDAMQKRRQNRPARPAYTELDDELDEDHVVTDAPAARPGTGRCLCGVGRRAAARRIGRRRRSTRRRPRRPDGRPRPDDDSTRPDDDGQLDEDLDDDWTTRRPGRGRRRHRRFPAAPVRRRHRRRPVGRRRSGRRQRPGVGSGAGGGRGLRRGRRSRRGPLSAHVGAGGRVAARRRP